MYPSNMMESIKKVEAAREANAVLEPARMTAEEKENLLSTYHPDYKQDEFDILKVGPNKGGKFRKNLPLFFRHTPALIRPRLTCRRSITM